MNIRDRVKELRRVPASELRPNPKNWRTHPTGQRDALRSLLGDIGYADAALAYELPDGSLQLIDGHLRAEESGDRPIPVLVLDVTEAEADKLLAVIDPLAALAGVDAARLDDLLAGAGQMPPALESWLAIQSEGAHAASLSPSSDAEGGSDSPALTYTPSQVVKLVLLAPDVAAVERALAATGEVNRGEALKLVCESYLREARQQNV